MAHFHDNALIGASGQGGYQIERSLRFNGSVDSTYLNRTPASAGNRKTWTWSAWVKFSSINVSSNGIFEAATNSSNRSVLVITGNSQLQWFDSSGGSTVTQLVTSQVFRDFSAWYHIVVAVDTTQATSSNRVKIYVNGSQVTAFGIATYPSQNFDTQVNATVATVLGAGTAYTPSAFYDGYLTEIHFIDGQALTPSSFGETDTITGVWKPKKYAGTYGTNGFYLNFSDNSGTTSTTLGKDSSGNGNNWTPNNFSVTAGSGNDSLIDTPTPYADGGNGRGNYATYNPLDGTAITANFYLSNGNLDLNVDNNSGYRNVRSTFSPEGFKGYFECVFAGTANGHVGFAYQSITRSNLQYQSAGTFYLDAGGDVKNGLTTIKAGCTAAFSTGDILQVAFDFTGGARNVWFGRNGTWGSNSVGVGVPSTGTNPVLTVSNIAEISGLYFAANTGGALTTLSVNFGQRAFAYTPPSGFLALNTQNLPEPTIKKGSTYFDTVTYAGATSGTAGAGTTQAVTGLGFSPDLVWIKNRSNANSHGLFDQVRGAVNALRSDLTNAEATTNSSGALSAFNSNGFTLANGSSGSDQAILTHQSGYNYVAWCWDESATPGFDIVTYTGTGSNTDINHNLGVTPSFAIIKQRNTAQSWWVWHTALGNNVNANNTMLELNGTAGTYAADDVFRGFTSSVFKVGTDSGSNTNGGTYVAYLWSEVAGFSKFGSYVGNGSTTDGPFIWCGFTPRFILIKWYKDVSSAESWHIYDTARQTYNTTNTILQPDSSGIEETPADRYIDILSNGFKLRQNGQQINRSGASYVFAAFASSPFKYSLAR